MKELHIFSNPDKANSLMPYFANNMFDKSYAILLLGDSVSIDVENIADAIPIYALIDDIKTRGLNGKVAHNLKLINYDEFVDLTVTYLKTISW